MKNENQESRVDLHAQDTAIGSTAKIIAGDVPALVWSGWDIASMPSITAIIGAASREAISCGDEYLAYFNGEQWADSVRAIRQGMGKPVLVLNRLPQLLAAALDAERRNDYQPPPEDVITAAKRIIAFYNKDAQDFLNYTASKIAEREIAR